MFTDKSIKGLKPKQTAYRLYEKGTDKGFGLKITPAGSKSFFIQYISDSGKQKFYNLGRYPSISLSDARDHCRKIRTAINQGNDPQIQVQQRYGAVADLIDYYLKCMVNDGKRTWQKVGADLNFNCKDILHLQAKDITPSHIKKILHNTGVRRLSE